MPDKHGWVVHATHPYTFQTHIIRRESGDGGMDAWAVHDVLHQMGVSRRDDISDGLLRRPELGRPLRKPTGLGRGSRGERMTLTPEQYVEQSGMACPNCGDTRFGFCLDREASVNANFVSTEVACNQCKATWKDEFTLTGYTNLTVPEEEADA